MNRFAWLFALVPLLCAAGCSNRPLAATLDCFFPSKITARPQPPEDGLFRPSDEDRDRLPAPNLRDLRGRDDLPRIGDPVAPEGPVRRNEAPWSRDANPNAMPLPDGGRF